jgi:hypothetical protein
MLGAFIIGFAGALELLTHARRKDLIAATAAYTLHFSHLTILLFLTSHQIRRGSCRVHQRESCRTPCIHRTFEPNRYRPGCIRNYNHHCYSIDRFLDNRRTHDLPEQRLFSVGGYRSCNVHILFNRNGNLNVHPYTNTNTSTIEPQWAKHCSNRWHSWRYRRWSGPFDSYVQFFPLVE